VVETYFAARRRLRLPHPAVAVEARDGFEACIAKAPEFSQAIAGHAVASLRCAFLLDDPDHAVARAADASVDRALAQAPELAETHLASAMLAGHHGEYACAIKELERALAIAPSYPDAHEYLAMFECEAGRPERGVPRARLALELDPSLTNAAYVLARAHAYRGDWEASLRQLDQVDQLLPPNAIGPVQTRLRMLAWKRDFPAIERILADQIAFCPAPGFIRLVGETILGKRPLADALAAHTAIIAKRKNRRFISYTFQVTAEIQALRGDIDGALESVRTSVDAVLIDVEWMRSCPLLEPLRSTSAFAVEMDRVRVRSAALWS
jgi:tetratricopeptide (TPR) repeat protein